MFGTSLIFIIDFIFPSNSLVVVVVVVILPLLVVVVVVVVVAMIDPRYISRHCTWYNTSRVSSMAGPFHSIS